MNEEITVRLGGDLGPIGAALRSLRGMMSHAAESIKDSFKDVFHHLTAPLSIAGAFEAIHSLMEDVKNIKRISESTGLDIGITQDLLNLGKASGIAGDAIEAAMDKFVKNLAPGTDPEQALYNLADRMAAIEDPTERARLAVENFGKSGVKLIPILEQGSEGIRKMSEEWGKLSEAEVEELEHANKTIEKTESRAKVQLARTIEWVTQIGKTVKDAKPSRMVDYALFPWLAAKDANKIDDKEVEAEMAVDNAKEAQKIENARKAAEKKKEDGIKAARDLAQQEELINAKPHEKVLLLTRRILELRREMEDSDSEKEKAKLAEKMLSFEKERKSVSDEIARNAKTAAEKQKQISKEILSDQEKLTKLGRERHTAETSEYMPTLEELANSGRSRVSGSTYVWQQGPFAQQARELMNLQFDAKQSLIYGNKDRFNQDRTRIEELKAALRDEGVMTADDRLQSIDENIAKTKEHMGDLAAQAKGAGIKVVGTDD